MRQRPKSPKPKAKLPVARKSPKSEGSRVRDLERRLAEALQREKATSEILRVISGSPTDMQPVFDAVAEAAARLCESFDAAIFRREGDRLLPVAHHGPIPISTPAQGSIGELFTLPLDRGTVPGRAVLDGRTIDVIDLQAEVDEFPVGSELARRQGFRTSLTVPLMREGVAIGCIVLRRTEAQLFTERQVALLETFADQAVIAIENVRLFTELQARNAELTTSLDTQTATSDILRVISRSQTDVQPVFDAIVNSAVRLLRANTGVVLRIAGELIELAAFTSIDEAGDAVLRASFPRPVQSEGASAQAIRDRAPVNIADAHTDPRFPEAEHARARTRGYRSRVVVPMLGRDQAIGAIGVTRREPGGFSDDQIALLQTFADQAVIAIENVRLFKELQASNRDLTTALEQQTATSELLKVIGRSTFELQPVFDTLAENAVRLCEADRSYILRFDGQLLRLIATHNVPPEAREFVERNPIAPGRHSASARAALERRTIHLYDVESDPEYTYGVTRVERSRTLLGVPMLRAGELLGVLIIYRFEVRPFTDGQIALLETFADQAAIAIENARLFKELQEKNRALTEAHAQVTEALEQKTAASEILRVISQSPTDVQPVFDAIAESAVRLCDAEAATVTRFDGEWVHIGAIYGLSAARSDALRGTFPMRPSGAGGAARAIRDSAIVHIPDVLSDQEYEIQQTAIRSGYRGVLAVPMLHKGHAIGAITLGRAEPGEFSDTQVQLLRTFADQAVIAIENVRLFKELQEKNRALTQAHAQVTESLGQQTATSDLLKVIGRSTFDLKPVFETLAENAVRLCEAEHAFIYGFDGQVLRTVATYNIPSALKAFVEANPTRPGRESGAGRAAMERRTVHIEDIQTEAEYTYGVTQVGPMRTLLAIPMLRAEELLGVIVITRPEVRLFTDGQIALMETFADQAAIAIENARLFREIEHKSRQLQVASQHKSEFLANMSHELRTPLNAIIGFSEVLTDRMFGELNEKQDEYLKDIYASGQHLLSLINDILDLSKIEAGRMELELTDFHLPTALDNALTLVRERAGRRSITLQMSVDKQLGEVRADERKIRQVVLNLLSNAIKFTPEGGRIEVGAVPRDGSVEVSVGDTGVGIAPEDQEAVFEEFRQVGTAEKKAEGTGLGLTLCRKFIELHGGRIWVKSQEGVGSTFTFTIPVHRGE